LEIKIPKWIADALHQLALSNGQQIVAYADGSERLLIGKCNGIKQRTAGVYFTP
jgi:hypothetical protein